VVIALACRKLPPAQRTQGILWGTAGAIVLRVVLILFAMTLLNLPFLKLADALLPARARRRRPQQRAMQRPVADRHRDHHRGRSGDERGQRDRDRRRRAALGRTSTLLVVLDLLISIPIIVAGSQLVIKLMARFPALVTDPVLADPSRWTWMLKIPQSGALRYTAAVTGALLVLSIGKALAARKPPLGTV